MLTASPARNSTVERRDRLHPGGTAVNLLDPLEADHPFRHPAKPP